MLNGSNTNCILFFSSLHLHVLLASEVTAAATKQGIPNLLGKLTRNLFGSQMGYFDHPETSSQNPVIKDMLKATKQLCALPINTALSAKETYDGFIFMSPGHPDIAFRTLIHKSRIIPYLQERGISIIPVITSPTLDQVSGDDYIISFFKDPSEYMHFLMDCSEMAIATDKEPSCLALLTKKDDHYVYRVEKCGSHISDNIIPFRANEENVKKFNAGCEKCAQLLAQYLRTKDPKQMPKIDPFGDLSWNENTKKEIAERPQENPPPKGKYFPELRNARVVKRIDAGSHELVLLTDIDAIGVIKYLHMLTVTNKSSSEIAFLVTAELGSKHHASDPECFLGAFTGAQHLNYGKSNECVDLPVFEARAIEIAKREIGLPDDCAQERKSPSEFDATKMLHHDPKRSDLPLARRWGTINNLGASPCQFNVYRQGAGYYLTMQNKDGAESTELLTIPGGYCETLMEAYMKATAYLVLLLQANEAITGKRQSFMFIDTTPSFKVFQPLAFLEAGNGQANESHDNSFDRVMSDG